ncbi:MAG: hypothetical protein K8L99_03785 [Anaerolineae bacterium]|nr:hypothetical protein [Anaerolineae bacterium]
MQTYTIEKTSVPSHSDTLTPQLIIHNYIRAYYEVHGREPHVRHIGGQWYYLNGETVHRMAIFNEITHLRETAHYQRKVQTNKSIIQRLIVKLRGI